ncbi:hypothetical protein [Synechococcus sp. PCC 7336]|uniref:hypothetical protein n=1 Tax=Synechococcus sp. PCC 7336 TaxID=195250 RepID=UPI0012EA0C85|nr:hypothetical protein [Synechococcus sp. PCC 7336]
MKSFSDTHLLRQEVEGGIKKLKAIKKNLPKRILESLSASVLCYLTLFVGSGNIAAKIAVSAIGPLSTYHAMLLSLKLRKKSDLNQELRKLKKLNKSLLRYSCKFGGSSKNRKSSNSGDSSKSSRLGVNHASLKTIFWRDT